MGSTSGFVQGMVVMLLMFSTAHLGLAQNTPSDWVALHNQVRRQYGIGPVSWNQRVAAFAQSYAQQMASDCSFLKHSGTSSYGENLYMSSSMTATASNAVALWASEKRSFDFSKRLCPNIYKCGHFSQVVWRASTAIGCARAYCRAGRVGVVIICNYSPPGNVIGMPAY